MTLDERLERVKKFADRMKDGGATFAQIVESVYLAGTLDEQESQKELVLSPLIGSGGLHPTPPQAIKLGG